MASSVGSVLNGIRRYIPISKESSTVLLLICGWYFCSISLSLYNKWMLDPKYGLKLPYPLFITSIHQFLLWIISFAYIQIQKRRKLKKDIVERQRLNGGVIGVDHEDRGNLEGDGDGEIIVSVDKMKKFKYYMKYIVPTAIASAGDIGFGNLSFKYVPLTIYTVVKSSSIAFVLLFGCMFKLEKYHWKLGFVVGFMFIGVICMAFKPSSSFNSDNNNNNNNNNNGDASDEETESQFVFGVICVLMSACLSGLRWVYTQIVLKKKDVDNLKSNREEKKKPKKKNPIYTIYQLAPIMGFTLLFTSLLFERPDFHIIFIKIFTFNTSVFDLKHFFIGLLLILCPGLQVFFMTICEFGILQRSKVLTLSIAGIFKELITIWVSMLILHERIETLINWLGMIIILLDVCYYNWYRYMEKLSNDRERLPSLSLSSSSSSPIIADEYQQLQRDDYDGDIDIATNSSGSISKQFLKEDEKDVEDNSLDKSKNGEMFLIDSKVDAYELSSNNRNDGNK